MEGISSANILLIAISMAVVIAIGAFIAMYFKKKTTTSAEWAVGGRTLPPYVIVFTQFATLVGGGVLVGHVGIGYNFGLAPLMYGVCGAAGCFIMAIIAKWLRKNEFTTIPDILEKVFGKSSALIILGAIFAIIVPFGWIASQAIAFGNLFSAITGLDITLIITVMMVICVLFTLPAGFNSVAWSDFVFGVMMLVLCVITGVFALNLGGGWSNIVANLDDPSIVSFPGGLMSAGLSTTALWFFAATPGMMTNQMTLQRVCAADTEKNARKTLIISGILIAVIEIWCVVLGVSVRAVNPTVGGEMATGWFLTQIPSWVVALFAGFIATTIITTTDSALQSVAVNLTQDIYKKFIRKDAEDKHYMRISRIFTVCVALLALLLAVSFRRVLDLIVATYAYSASGLLVPIYIGYVFRDKNILTPRCGVIGMIGGLIGCAIAHMLNTAVPYAIWGIVASFVCMMIAIAIEKNSKTKKEVAQ